MKEGFDVKIFYILFRVWFQENKKKIWKEFGFKISSEGNIYRGTFFNRNFVASVEHGHDLKLYKSCMKDDLEKLRKIVAVYEKAYPGSIGAKEEVKIVGTFHSRLSEKESLAAWGAHRLTKEPPKPPKVRRRKLR